MRKYAILAALFLLSGCGSLSPVPTEVRIPVSVPCFDKAPDRPALATDADLIRLSNYQLVIALRQDQLALRGYVAILEAVIQACVR